MHVESVHEGIKYSCELCDFKASHKPHLKIHVKCDHEAVMYSCELCDYTGTDKSTLNKTCEICS